MIALAVSSLLSAQGWTGVAGDLSRAATGSLVAAVWQGILLAGAAWLGLRMLPRTPAAVRFAIWFAVFLIVTVLPMVPLLPHAAGVAQAGRHGAWLTLDERWSVAIAAVWLFASLVRAGTLLVAALRVRTLWKRATPVELNGASLLPINRGTAAMGGAHGGGWLDGIGHRKARLCTSDEVDRPTIIGFFSPKILIPGWLLNKLTAAELEQIVLHEAGHLGRADDWMNLLQKIALVVFPLNPALAWVERRLCFERELACDERVLNATRAPRAYAACLATLAEYRLGRRGLALALGAVGRESELGQRVSRILRRDEHMNPAHSKLLLGGAMLGLLGAATGLAHCPQVVAFSTAAQQTASVQTSAPIGGASPTGYRYQAVVFHPKVVVRQNLRLANVSSIATQKRSTLPHLETKQHVPHEEFVKANQNTRLLQSSFSSQWPLDKIVAEPVHMVRTAATALRQRARLNSISDVEPSQPAAGMMQWVVVTSWQGADGSRMVLTTAVPNGARRSTPEIQSRTSEQLYPYAAVPVPDGWLIFQL